MQRTSFELEFESSTLSAAVAIAESKISAYLGVPMEDVSSIADIEIKLKTNSEGVDRTHVYASIKRQFPQFNA